MKLEFLDSGSPECPLIRLYGFDNASAVRLMELFCALAKGLQQYIRLDDQLGVEAIQGCQLNLRLGSRNCGIEQISSTAFECVLTYEGWAEVADLTKSVCEARDSNCYQWLNEDGKVSLLLSSTGHW